MDRVLAVAAGSVVGGLARHLLTMRFLAATGPAFPWGTLAVNVSGCFLIGAFDSWGAARGTLTPNARLLLMTGFCGAYTTFSTLLLDSARLAEGGQLLLGLGNYLGSGALGLLAFRAGAVLAGVL